MLRLPRRIPPAKWPSTRKLQHAHSFGAPRQGTALLLTRATKISWIQFEALRIKFARTVTAKRRISKRAWFKQHKQQEQAQRALRHANHLTRKKHSKVWYCGFPHLPYYANNRGARMGKGKGSLKSWTFKGKPCHVVLIFRHSNRYSIAAFIHKAKRLLPCYARANARALTTWFIPRDILTYPTLLFAPYSSRLTYHTTIALV